MLYYFFFLFLLLLLLGENGADFFSGFGKRLTHPCVLQSLMNPKELDESPGASEEEQMWILIKPPLTEEIRRRGVLLPRS
jgi:hypothetical protein